ncbi:hypothetical protein A0H81_11449 [Grifola frondosa]|uniref:Uncharacterized protein n=1 Tax=Grifola frondosa TaxID=5627 RepID=A0A1C7M048_GRIFR|nr:hypothetical protein A0H81_11449 [Grifola frondosa]
MAEAGPSSASSPISTTSTPSASQSRHSRVRFPVDDAFSSPGDDASRKTSSVGLGSSPILRKATPGKGNGSLAFRQQDGRRRVKSVDAVIPPSEQSHLLRSGELGAELPRRTSTVHRKTSRKDKEVRSDVSAGPSEAFSDEYDLYPRILEDVQRALKLKARREARIKSLQLNAPPRDVPVMSDTGSSISANSSTGIQAQHPPPMPHVNISTESEIDFSPSTGTIPLHPVPSSSNGGATLDWTALNSEDEKSERRWTLSITKRKPKDKFALPSGRTVVEKQDSLYADKLLRIRATAKQHTLRKAAITSDQLERRYSMLFSPPRLNAPSMNILEVVRWYDRQDTLVKTSLDKLEPLSWFKHLWDKRGQQQRDRPPWYLTALIVEEFVKFHTSPQTMETIPEDEVAPKTSPTAPSLPENMSPSSGSWSWASPRHSLEPAISRKRSSYDAQISFEAIVESGKESIGGDSEGLPRSWRNSLPGTDSGRSSIYSGMFGGVSPTNSRKHLRNIARRIGRKANASDDALSSAHNSVSEHSPSEDGHQKTRTRPSSPLAQWGRLPRMGDSLSLQKYLSFYSGDERTPKPKPEAIFAPQSISISPTPNRALPPRRPRTSLPSSGDIFVQERQKRQRQADEEQERQEYEQKAEMLEEILSQNYRTRHLLQRVGASVREYDSVQAGLSGLLGMPYAKIPADVLEAFTHDPSAVTSGTRRFKSWRAVEDIHDRIVRQREVVQTFAASISSEREAVAPERNIFEEPITSLTRSLKQLKQERERLILQGGEVEEALRRVKRVHATVKKEYNDTLAQTSLVYPELSQIVALEENYRNHYQQFWDIGLDALTLLLDTVTPFWRNYGKVIGEDVQDFLIIPWYRNEFTGEPKRYSIQRLPRRSFRHWVGLLCLSLCSVCVAVLQARAAISLFNLPWITNIGLWWIFMPVFYLGLFIQWTARLICCIDILFITLHSRERAAASLKNAQVMAGQLMKKGGKFGVGLCKKLTEPAVPQTVVQTLLDLEGKFDRLVDWAAEYR